MKQNGEMFECYSRKLYGYLTMKGIYYVGKPFKHNKTGKICYTYLMTEELAQALKDWTNSKPID